MASRQEEKRRRREERLAKEAAAARAAARHKRLRRVLGGGAGVAAVAAVVAAIALGAGDGGGGQDGPRPASAGGTELPELARQEIGDLEAAARAAGCKLGNPESAGEQHEDTTFTAADYETNPPTSGTHNPMPAEDGVYEPGNALDLGMSIHALEHSRIAVQYKPGTPAAVVAKLEAFLAESDGYHLLLYENTTGMPYEVAATAWTHSLTCPTYSDKVIDALRTFRTSYIDQGPEQVP